MTVDYGDLEFTRPAKHIKAVNVPAVPQRIFDGMRTYENASRGFIMLGYERSSKSPDGQIVEGGIILYHRPESEQVSQVYRMSTDVASTQLERLTYFDIGTGRTIATFRSIAGEDWRGFFRGGGAIMAMDLDGNEQFQLWRYWEDAFSEKTLPMIDGELDNAPGKGRIERLTNDGFKYTSVVISQSDKFMLFCSNKENKRDTLVYVTELTGSKTGAKADGAPFTLPSRLLTPTTGQGTTQWAVESVSIDDKYILITKIVSSSCRAMYTIDISGPEPTAPQLVTLPNSSEKLEEISNSFANFSQNTDVAHTIHVVTNAYGDFDSVVSYDIETQSVTHVTTPQPELNALRRISYEMESLKVTPESLLFTANIEGWTSLFVMPLSGSHKNKVIEVQLEWEKGWVTCHPNNLNGKANEVILKLSSYRSRGFVARIDITSELRKVKVDADGNPYIPASLATYSQAAAISDPKAVEPQLIKFKSFDGMQIPAVYYHPSGGKSVVPVVIGIHGGPASQATAQYRTPTHGYLLNELGCAVIYPNVRGSSGYGKTYMAADDVEKREDSVKDIGALLDYIGETMQNELDSSRIALTGGSYGGYMVFASLTFYSSKLMCGIANFGISHWPTFLQNTAAVRRANRRREYGDETIPEIKEFLERISPINNASKITVPLLITHGETDSRVTVDEAVNMYRIVSKNVPTELVICEMEGHGYKQKSVIEYTNAAAILFLERYLVAKAHL
ncbi:Alpha/Beta hydrolase protein [Hygrophoropsis aurantiaca]|uniref:Alpha/Beta hydrolase protein n=1 Tax=Hygrophoropsis aurantiaca TaxID=72124 RepID=A0ACB8AE45_9AGAM|nr:Alpha/Beta hydrolase protein [Hygrophoropsis aurantiaca]